MSDGCSCEIVKGLFRKTSLDSFVAGVDFSPCFLEKADPELSFSCVGKSRHIVEIGQVIIHVNG